MPLAKLPRQLLHYFLSDLSKLCTYGLCRGNARLPSALTRRERILHMIIVGELINTSRPEVNEAVEERDERFFIDLAQAQEKAGVAYIDVTRAAASTTRSRF